MTNILPDSYDETAMMVEIELSSAAFLRRTENLDRWLKSSGFVCEMVLKKEALEFEPLFCLEDVLSVLSIFEQYVSLWDSNADSPSPIPSICPPISSPSSPS